MVVSVSYSLVYNNHYASMKRILTKLYNSKSKHIGAQSVALCYEFVYGHMIYGISFDDIANGKASAQNNPNLIADPYERANAWIARIPHVSLKGSIGRWRGFTKLDTIPQEVKDFELECALNACDMEKSKKKLAKTQITKLIKDGLVIVKGA